VILAVALNPAVDVTYHLDELRRSDTNRVERVVRRAGGKSVNVARVLRALGTRTQVLGFGGGQAGPELAAELTADGVAHELIPIAGYKI
jgi:tagatose 6-phosphate kinase